MSSFIDADALKSKEYKLPNGKTAVFEYDHNGIGKITLECLDELMAMITDKLQRWIPCNERLPKDLEIVNITWVNRRPAGYYAGNKNKPFTATAIRYNDKWWWYSPICEDLLAEYGKSECDKMHPDIEVTAWMPLPKPWEGAGNDKECHKPEGEYYRAYCEERKEETYCEGCKFWY